MKKKKQNKQSRSKKSRKVLTKPRSLASFKKNPDSARKIKVKVIGLGGGASSIVSEIALPRRGVSYFIADTDNLSLSKFKNKPEIKILPFGQNLTRSMGTGMDVELGRLAAEQDKDKFSKILKDCDFCIFVVCLGGGIGSGSISVLSEIAREQKIISYAIFTLPFAFERERKLEIAKNTLNEVRNSLNAITVIPNERIFQIIDRKTSLKKALSVINKELASSLSGLINMIYNAGIINIDFADIKTILSGRKSLSYLNRSWADGKDRSSEALRELLHNPLYSYDVSNANRVLFNISGPLDLSLSEVSEISEGITETINKNSKIIFGVESKKSKKGVDITLLALGCDSKSVFPRKGEEKNKRKKMKTKKKMKDKTSVSLKKQGKKREKHEGDGKKKHKPDEKKKHKLSKQSLTVKKKVGTANKKTDKIIPDIQEREKKIKVRKNGLQVQKDIKEIEKEFLEKEEIWEAPAFLKQKGKT